MIIYTQNGEKELEIKSVKELIAVFDQPQENPLYLNHIYNNIKNWGADNIERTKEEEFIYEDLAFSLVENVHTDAWGTRFGPINYVRFGDDVLIENPKFDDITYDAISYWERRINEVQHPILKIQYYGLVHTFKEKVTGQKCPEEFLRNYFDTIINASENDYILPLLSVQNHLPVAFEIAKTYPDLLPRIKSEYLRITNTAPLPYVGEWLAYFDLMLNNITEKGLFSDMDKQELVDIIETRLKTLISFDPDASDDKKLNPFMVKDVAEKLATYYKQTNKKDDKERVISYVEKSFRAILSQGTPLHQLVWLMQVQQCYFKFGMTSQAQVLYQDIQSASKNAKNSLQAHEITNIIPKGTIDRLIADINKGTEDEVYNKFVQKMMPKKDDIQALVKRQEDHPYAGTIRTQILSEAGLPLSIIDDEIGNEYYICAKFIEHEEPVMRMVVQALQEKLLFSQEKIVKHIMHSNLINQDRRAIIEKGVQFYLDGDAVTACHLLMPQIEHAICTLALKLNAPALRAQPRGNGYMIQLMDKLFDLDEIEDALGSDAVFYLRSLLTEQRGLNLRNYLCHGLINPLYFDINKADRIIHVLLLLGGLIIEEIDS